MAKPNIGDVGQNAPMKDPLPDPPKPFVLKTKKGDGTGRLCFLLYGKDDMSKIIGGADAQMLHDAADEIERLRKKVTTFTDNTVRDTTE